MRLSPSLPRLIATDLDGTLLRADHSVSPRTRRAIAEASRVGIEVLFVTARPPRWMDPLVKIAGPHGKAIILGGGAVWDLHMRTAQEVVGFSDDATAKLIADLRAAIPGIGLCLERVSEPVFDHVFAGIKVLEHIRDSWLVEAVETTLGRGLPPVAKILALHPVDLAHARSMGPASAPVLPTADQQHFFDVVEQVTGKRAQLAYSGAGGLAELFAPHVSKAEALQRWCARRNIYAAEVWAFGDMPNDLPMLTWAGRGFAVANAHPEVLAAADAVVPSNQDDGVAVTIQEALAKA